MGLVGCGVSVSTAAAVTTATAAAEGEGEVLQCQPSNHGHGGVAEDLLAHAVAYFFTYTPEKYEVPFGVSVVEMYKGVGQAVRICALASLMIVTEVFGKGEHRHIKHVGSFRVCCSAIRDLQSVIQNLSKLKLGSVVDTLCKKYSVAT